MAIQVSADINHSGYKIMQNSNYISFWNGNRTVRIKILNNMGGDVSILCHICQMIGGQVKELQWAQGHANGFTLQALQGLRDRGRDLVLSLPDCYQFI